MKIKHIYIIRRLFFPALLICLATCGDPGFIEIKDTFASIQILTTNPSGDFHANGAAIENSMVALINNAKSSVQMAVYNFDSRKILNALLNAKNRGLTIAIVGDYHEIETAGYQAMIQGGLDLIAGNQNAIQHNKFLIIDEKILVTGTGNFSRSDFFHNDNHFLIIRDEAIAAIYQSEFQQMHTGFFSTLKSSFRMSADRPQTTLPVKVFFSPQESSIGIREMVNNINLAKDSIYYMIFAFSHDDIAAALSRAARRGVKVYGIHDSSFIKGTSQEAARLFMAGYKSSGESFSTGPFIHVDGNTNIFFINGIQHGGKMHCKTMIIDPDTDHGLVMTGSFNWSNNAVENNDENLLTIENPDVAQEIKKQWDKAWKISKTLNSRFSKLGGSTAELHDIYISEINSAGTSDGSSFSENDDYIEIVNNSAKAIDITHWTIQWSASSGDILSYSFPDENNGVPPANATLLPGELRIIYSGNSDVIHKAATNLQNGMRIPNSRRFTLPEADVSIAIYDRSMNLIDNVVLPYLTQEGYTDPLQKSTASMNRRILPEGKPASTWYTSKIQCRWSVCQSPYFYGSPGYKNEPAGPVQFKNAETRDDSGFTVSFSGDIRQCNSPAGFSISGNGGNIPIDDITILNENTLVFHAAGADDPSQMYLLKSRASDEYMSNTILFYAPDIFLGTDTGLSVSHDNGVTFQTLPLNGIERQKIHQIFFDNADGRVYVASDRSLYITSNRGASFKKVQIDTEILADMVYNVGVNSTSLAAATANGLYIADKNSLVFQKISDKIFFSIYLSDSIMLAGGTNTIYNFIPSFTTTPAIIPVNGTVHSLKKIAATIYAGTTSGLYSSIDGLAFSTAYPAFFSNMNINDIHEGLWNNPMLSSYHQISAIYYTVVQTFDIQMNQKPSMINSLSINGSMILAAGDYGLYAGAFLNLLKPLNSYPCGSDGFLPAGSIMFNGYGTTANRTNAEIRLNELSLENKDGHDWIELEVTQSGSLKNTKIEYTAGNENDILYSFSDHHVNAGDIILVYLQSPLTQKLYSSSGKTATTINPYKFYSTHLNLNRGDGLIFINIDGEIHDAIYYSNADGNISAEFTQGGLRRAYFNNRLQQLLTHPLPFPVNGWNDNIVQSSAVEIPATGNERAIVKTSAALNLWNIESSTTPGVK